MNVLERLKELEANATKQWELEIKSHHGFAIRPDIMWNGDCSVRPREENLINTKLAIALRNNAPALIAAVEAAKEVAEDACSSGGKDCHIVDSNLIDDLRFALAELDEEAE